MADSNTTTKLIDLDNLSTYHSLMDAKKEEHSIILTLAQYNALTPEEKMNGKTYYISDAGSSGMVITASDVLMTGYSKASSASAITTNDTGSIAFGKLEKGLEDTNSLIPSSATTSNKLATAADIPGVATASAVGLVKPDGTTVTIDANGVLSASADLSNYIEKSATEGLVMNDGSIDTSKHVHLQPTGKNLTGELEAKTWTGLTSFGGSNIWTDGDNIYYSNSSTQYVLDKSTSTWNKKTWNGLTYFNGAYIWTDGDNIYCSNSTTQRVLDKSTSTWNTKTWNGYSSIYGSDIWTDGDNIYYSNSSSEQYVLDKSTSTWISKTWNGYTDISGRYIWTDGDNIYYSLNSNQYVLDKSTSTWISKTWNGYSSITGQEVWTDGTNIYYSNSSSVQYVLDKSTDTWNTKTWTGLTNFSGSRIWTDGDNIYYSYSSNQYVFLTEAVYADGFVKSDGTIDTNEYAKTSEVSAIKKTRYTITATNWSNSVDADGYYTYTISNLNPTLDTSYPPNVYLTGADNNTFYTDTEAEQYSYVAQCNLTTSTTLVLYAKTKPDSTFYVFVTGLEA